MLETLTLGPLQTNCYVYADAGEAMVVDAAADADVILAAAGRLGARICLIVCTHAHFDHIGALDALARETAAPVYVHSEDIPLLAAGGLLPANLTEDDLPGDLPSWFVPPPSLSATPIAITDGQHLPVGRADFEVLHTPGHTPGSCCLYCPEQAILFSGDTLFRLGVGRADLPGGDSHALLRSIKRRLFTLPDATVVYPGHGPSTSIGLEKRRNPFVRASV